MHIFLKKSIVLSFVMAIMGIIIFGSGVIVNSNITSAANKKVELHFMHFFTKGDARHGVVVQVLKDFAAKNPDIIVKEDALAHDLYQTKVETLGASRQLPDVFFMKGNWAEEFSKAGGIKPCNDILKADPVLKNAFLSSALANHIYKGKIYSLPYTMDLNALMYYNKPLFDKYNLQFPKTWDELLNVIKVFNTNSIIPIALGNKDQWLVPTGWLSCYTALIGGPDYMNKLCFENAKYTQKPYIEALKAMQTLVEVNAFNKDFNSIDNYQMYGLYGTEKVAMFSAGSWAASTLVENVSKEISDNTRIGVMPVYPNGKGELYTIAGGSGWGVNINAKLTGAKRAAAIKLMKAFCDQKFAKYLIEIANMPPALKDVQYDHNKVPALFNQIIEVQKKAKVTPVFDQVIHPELIDVMNKTTQAVMAKDMTPEKAAAKVQAVKDRLQRRK
jgi:raffinose/stachyose/melibiose transport system substrate-binding protein